MQVAYIGISTGVNVGAKQMIPRVLDRFALCPVKGVPRLSPRTIVFVPLKG
jgi:hypothetical protein